MRRSPITVKSFRNKPIRSLAEVQTSYKVLFRRFFLILTLASIIPLAVIGAGAYFVFKEIIYNKSVEDFQHTVESHTDIVELFLNERLQAMKLAFAGYDLDNLKDQSQIEQLHSKLNEIYSDSFQDLGVIDNHGNHLAYVGSYDLLDKNYSNETWFEQVQQTGFYISDVFLGFRQTPHFIIAVKRVQNKEFWILRASINSDIFSKLVTRGAQGQSGDCYIVDKNGRYQTLSRYGAALLEQSHVGVDENFKGVKTISDLDSNGNSLLRSMKWINQPRWLLIVEQKTSEFMSSVKEATTRGMVVFFFGTFIILAATYFTTNFLVRIAVKTAMDKEKLNQQFEQASKLAAIGELSTGLAHEINNPLAIILSEQTNISDLLEELLIDKTLLDELHSSVALVKKQVLRCRSITQKMLKFGRQGSSQPEYISSDTHLKEIVQLLKKQAAVNNIELQIEIQKDLPTILIDSIEFEQVVTNLINNAIQAVGKNGVVLVSAAAVNGSVHFTVEDTGPGIEDDKLDHIFTPFFTTKPAGQGTGLGLSVCYGIVMKWNGQIWVESVSGKGAAFHFIFPVSEPVESLILP